MPVQITMEGQAPKFLVAPSYTLGRGAGCDVLLPENDGMVSRQHARLERDAGETWWIVDLGSTNGTYLNGEKLSNRHALQSGDQIGIGRTQIGFLAPQSAAKPTSSQAAPLPARATETIFTTREEVQAKMAATPSMSPSIASAPIAPPIPPAATPFTPPPTASPMMTPPIEPPISSSVAVPASMPEAPPVALGDSPKASGPTAPVKEESAPLAAPAAPELTVFNVAAPAVPAELAPPHVETAETDVEVEVSEAAKQCTRCRQIYVYSQESCPACGHTGFKMKMGGRVLSGDGSPTIEPSPDLEALKSGVAQQTPFDRELSPNPNPAQRHAGEVSGMISRSGAQLPQEGNVTNVINPLLGFVAAGCGALMLVSLFLPWAQVQMLFISGSISYAQLCQFALQNASNSNDIALKAIGEEPRILLFFLPAVATLLTLSGGLTALLSAVGNAPTKLRGFSTGAVLGLGGVLGLIASGVLYVNLTDRSSGFSLTGLLGPGFFLFALTSAVATLAGFGAGALVTMMGQGSQRRS